MIQPAKHKANILIIDDVPENLDMLARMLIERDYQIRPAITGELALEAIQVLLPDIILLDIMMPDIDGYEICQRLKADDRTRDIPVLFISALHREEEKVKAFHVGGVDYITKPFHTEEVLVRVDTHLALRNMRKQLQEQNRLLQQEIAERKKTEEALRIATDEALDAQRVAEDAQKAAEIASRAKSEFIANMSHELRTPLSWVLGFSDMLKNAPDLTDDQREYAMMIYQGGEHLLRLLNDMIDIAKLEANIVKPEPVDFRLSTAIKTVLQLSEFQARQKQLTFVYECDPDVPDVLYGDEKRLRQILLNLLGNAVKFTEQGRVTLRIMNAEWQKISSEYRHLKFEIIDTGIGILPERIEQIFAPFTQIRTQKTSIEGIGLGLTVSQRLLRKLGSELRVTSIPGQGSTFWFEITFPMSE